MQFERSQGVIRFVSRFLAPVQDSDDNNDPKRDQQPEDYISDDYLQDFFFLKANCFHKSQTPQDKEARGKGNKK